MVAQRFLLNKLSVGLNLHLLDSKRNEMTYQGDKLYEFNLIQFGFW